MLDAPPQISVLLPVFNGGDFLVLAVRSILAQSIKDFELLVIDDGSTDNAIDKISKLGDSRIHILGGPSRRGLAARLNEGIDAAQGRYIARMDADDLAFPQRLERQALFLDEHPDVDMVGCRAVVFRESADGVTGIIGLLPFAGRHQEICGRPWRGFPLPHPTWMGRAEWFRRFHYAIPEVSRAEDQEFLLRSHGESRFACLDAVLLGYRQGPFNLKKTLIARRHLWAAQERYFLLHRQWTAACLALLLTLAKMLVDVLAAVPGCDRLFFMRMGGAVSDDIIRKLDILKKDLASGAEHCE